MVWQIRTFRLSTASIAVSVARFSVAMTKSLAKTLVTPADLAPVAENKVVRHNAGSRQLRREEAVGWSHRPRTRRACDADSTRIHHAVMERPAFGVAITERWSQRVSGVTHGSGPLCFRQNRFRRYTRYLRDARPADAAFSGGDGVGFSDFQPLATHTLAS